MKKLLSAFLCMAIFLSLFSAFTLASASEASGLSAFTDKNEYTDGMFTDVASSSWYASGIKTAYTKDMMLGVSDTEFSPEEHMPWSQAITLAVRLHAVYRGKDIAQTGGVWYRPFVEYARMNNLLPDMCPGDSAIDSTDITREGLAALFRSVIDKKDLPGINDQTIPDLNTVRAEYRGCVSDMYASGIFTGKDGGAFVPKGTATRAEVATLVSRLLCPSLRVSHDSAANPYMAGQMGNFFNDGIAARKGDTVYYNYIGQANAATAVDTIIARRDSGEKKIIYTSNEPLHHLSIGPDGQLYFIQRDTVRRLDLDTLKSSVLYTSQSKVIETPIIIYQFYGGELYVSDEYSGEEEPWDWRYRISRISDGKAAPVVDDMPCECYYIYFFNDKMYYMYAKDSFTSYKGELRSFDLKTGQDTAVLDEVSYGNIAFQGGTVFWIENNFDTGGEDYFLLKTSLELPEEVETVMTIPKNNSEGIPSIFADDTYLYLLYPEPYAQLWRMSQSGAIGERFAFKLIGSARCATVTGQAVIFQGGLSYSIHMESVYLPDETFTTYSEFLGRPYMILSENRLEAAGNIKVWNKPDEKVDEVTITPLRAYVTTEGDTAVEVLIKTPEKLSKYNYIKPEYIDVKLKNGSGAEFEWRFSFGGGAIIFENSQEMETLVFPSETLTTENAKNISITLDFIYR